MYPRERYKPLFTIIVARSRDILRINSFVFARGHPSCSSFSSYLRFSPASLPVFTPSLRYSDAITHEFSTIRVRFFPRRASARAPSPSHPHQWIPGLRLFSHFAFSIHSPSLFIENINGIPWHLHQSIWNPIVFLFPLALFVIPASTASCTWSEGGSSDTWFFSIISSRLA